MIRILIEKELKAILLSPKFAAVFAVCSILIVMSIYLGIEEYKTSMAHYETVSAQAEQQVREETEWIGLMQNVTRYPDPMQIFVTGINNDIGRQARISSQGRIKLQNSNYSENIIFAVFRSMDLMFIVQIVLSLFAILFTYDAINGERETGTLKLSFANPVPRTTYIIAKITGSWLGLVIPLLIPMLLGVALLLVYRIPMTPSHWQQLGLFTGISVLYFSFFICLGVLFSSIAGKSSGSFLYLLVIWVSLVLIIPRVGVMLAGQLIPVPTSAEITSKMVHKYRELSDKYIARLDELSNEQTSGMDSMYSDKTLTNEERQKRYDQIRDEYTRKSNEARNTLSREVARHDASINEDWRNRKGVRRKLGFSISRLSPASAYQLAAMDLAGTGLSLKTDYEDQLRVYSDALNKFREKKITESGGSGYSNPFEDKKPEPLDLSGMPQFKFINADLNKILQFTVIDIAIISFYILVIIAGTFVAFLRYDVR